jgi:hypothetical protein
LAEEKPPALITNQEEMRKFRLVAGLGRQPTQQQQQQQQNQREQREVHEKQNKFE